MTLNTLQRAAGAVSRRGLPAAALLALAVLGGCAAFEPKTPEQAVAERATQYWQARIQGDMGKAYSLLTPAYRAVRCYKGVSKTVQTVIFAQFEFLFNF